MDCFIDIETLPSADRQPFIDDAVENFRAPSSLTKAKAGEDLGITGDKLKFMPADEVKAKWEKEMASEKAEEVGDEAWRKTALDGTRGRVLCAAVNTGNDTRVAYGDTEDEADTLRHIFSTILEMCSEVHPEADKRKPFFIGHNVTFDLKFLFRRAVILGIRPPFSIPFQGRHNKDFYCTMQAWCDFKETISLDKLCKALGIEGKEGFDGSKVYDAWANGEHDRIKQYCADDVNKVIKLHDKLTFKK